MKIKFSNILFFVFFLSIFTKSVNRVDYSLTTKNLDTKNKVSEKSLVSYQNDVLETERNGAIPFAFLDKEELKEEERTENKINLTIFSTSTLNSVLNINILNTPLLKLYCGKTRYFKNPFSKNLDFYCIWRI